ncbi:MAG: alpha/beta hydrolase [Promethearchaeota archaeon]|jgi:acetyl esterase/lipase
MVSKQMENLIIFARSRGDQELTVEGMRKEFDQIANMVKVPKDAKCEPVSAGGVPAEWISVPESINDKVMLYFHGGGYVAGSINSHREYCVRLARASKTRVLIIDYRLAPEHPFPAALEDAIKAYQWLITSEGITPKHIVIAGESAGGGLTVATLLKLRDDKIKLPTAGISLSPFMDLAVTGDSIKTKVEVDPLTTQEMLELDAKLYLAGEDARNPLASPLYADLKGLPPLYIQVGTAELLLDDSIRFVDAAKAAGVNVKFEIWDDMIHMFQMFAAMAPEGQDAINKIGEFVLKSMN